MLHVLLNINPYKQHRDTVSLLHKAIGKDLEMAPSILSPIWKQKSEKIHSDLLTLKDRLNKLKEWVETGWGQVGLRSPWQEHCS
jgi:hypothetical protein